MISSVNDPYYFGPRYLGARRVIAAVPEVKVVQEVQTVKPAPEPVKELPPLPIGEFHDVSENFWAYDEITALAKAGIINGRAGSVFDPNDRLTRAQAAIILTNALELELSTVTSSFNDVSKDFWATQAIATVAKHGIFRGDENGNFRPNDLLTRAHAAVILANALKFDQAQAASFKTPSFSDVSDSFWAYLQIEVLAANGIISGSENRTFSPSGTTTRAHFSVMIYNSIQ